MCAQIFHAIIADTRCEKQTFRRTATAAHSELCLRELCTCIMCLLMLPSNLTALGKCLFPRVVFNYFSCVRHFSRETFLVIFGATLVSMSFDRFSLHHHLGNISVMQASCGRRLSCAFPGVRILLLAVQVRVKDTDALGSSAETSPVHHPSNQTDGKRASFLQSETIRYTRTIGSAELRLQTDVC